MTARRISGAKETGEKRIFRSVKGKRPDSGIVLTLAMLLLTGLIALYSASYYNAMDAGNPMKDVLSQLIGILLGLILMAFFWKIDYRVLNSGKITGLFLIVSLILLLLVALPGVGVYINGSRKWLRFGPVSFQPSELAKYAMILYMARALSGRQRNIRKFFSGLIPLFVIPGCMFILILMQPNLSTAGSILIVSAVMVMLAGARWLHLTFLAGAGLVVGAYYALSEPYRRARMISFVDPFKYLSNEGYQLAQSLMAFGSGGLFGMGLGRGRQKMSFLPYPESDFIFAIVGEDMGFAGCVFVMGLFMAFLFFCLRAAIRSADRFASLLSAGIASMIGVQTVLNIAVVIGLMPTTGLPLPFFSAGGTSVSVVMGAVGLILNISSENGEAF